MPLHTTPIKEEDPLSFDIDIKEEIKTEFDSDDVYGFDDQHRQTSSCFIGCEESDILQKGNYDGAEDMTSDTSLTVNVKSLRDVFPHPAPTNGEDCLSLDMIVKEEVKEELDSNEQHQRTSACFIGCKENETLPKSLRDVFPHPAPTNGEDCLSLDMIVKEEVKEELDSNEQHQRTSACFIGCKENETLPKDNYDGAEDLTSNTPVTIEMKVKNAENCEQICSVCQKREVVFMCDSILKNVCDLCYQSNLVGSKLVTSCELKSSEKSYTFSSCTSLDAIDNGYSRNRSTKSVIQTDGSHDDEKIQCSKTFCKINLKEITHSGIESHKCKVCENLFTSSTLKLHEKAHFGIKLYKCSLCEKSFSQSSGLKSHERAHSGIKPFKCNVCEKSFYRSDGLKYHNRTHFGIKPYKCNVCEKSFLLQRHLKSHEKIHSGDKPNKCNVCGKSYFSSCALKFHEKKHCEIKPHKCIVCEKLFCQLYQLKCHERTHSGVKPYKCSVCEKSFSRSGDLKTHETTHSGIKPYKCSVCVKSFSRPCDLKTHERTHSGIKPYKCSGCEKSFSRAVDLKTHARTHSGVKPYECNVCNKSFSQSGNLKTHERTHWC